MDKQINTSGLILCTCEGKISSRIDLEALAALFRKKKVHVEISYRLCKDWGPLEKLAEQSKLAGLVIGACRDEPFLSNLREKLTQAGVEEFSTRTFDLLEQSLFNLDKAASTRLAALLLDSLLEKAKRYPGASPENLKPYWFQSGEKVSRRKLFSIPKVRYDLIPSIEKQKCLAWKGCNFCFSACPKEAIVKESDKASIDKDLCTGCGACVIPCPTGCISYPGFSLLELEAQLEALLSSTENSAAGLNPLPEGGSRIITFVCSPAQETFKDFQKKNSSLAPNVLPVHVPCLTLASPYLIIKTLSLGAATVLLFSCGSGCPKGVKPEEIESNARMAQSLAEALGIQDKNIWHITQDNIKTFPAKIENIIRSSRKSGLPVLSKSYRDADGKLGPLLAVLGTESGKQGTHKLNGVNVPLGKVKIDPDICSFCELCTAHCPTGALRLEEGEGFSRILFNHQDCVACNLCIKMCPERKKGAIKVERLLDWDAVSIKSGEVLVESKQLCCSQCGAPIGTSLMIDRIRKRLVPEAATAFDLCSQCRFKVALFRNNEKTSD